MMDQKTTILNTLEHMLVQEFRACQELYRLNRALRLALIQRRRPEIHQLQARELAMRQDLMVQEHGRQVVVEKLFQLFPQEAAPSGTASTLQALLDPERAARFERLQEGIQILRAQNKALAGANQALARATQDGGLRNERPEAFRPPAAGAERIPAPSRLLHAEPSGS